MRIPTAAEEIDDPELLEATRGVLGEEVMTDAPAVAASDVNPLAELEPPVELENVDLAELNAILAADDQLAVDDLFGPVNEAGLVWLPTR